eukprot:5351268-Pyramimonas_sp.AAC.1
MATSLLPDRPPIDIAPPGPEEAAASPSAPRSPAGADPAASCAWPAAACSRPTRRASARRVVGRPHGSH